MILYQNIVLRMLIYNSKEVYTSSAIQRNFKPRHCYALTIAMLLIIFLKTILCMYMCKAEKPHLGDIVEIRGLWIYRTVADILQKLGTNICWFFERGLNVLYMCNQYIQILDITQGTCQNKRQRP